MKLQPFKLERYFAQYEFSVRYLLSSSDCDGMAQRDLVALADAETSALWDGLTLGYTESLGLPLLREEIAGLYEEIQADDVLVAAPEEAVFLALNAILESGDGVICTAPGYQSLYSIAEDIGCEVTKWMPETSSDWRFDPDALPGLIRPNTKLLIINFPHNPTGALPTRADFARIIEIAAEHGLYVLSDEMYRLLELDPNDRLPAAADLYDRAISLSGMSKVFGLAGLRIGWLATTNRDLLRRVGQLKDYTTICSSAPSEILALMALRARETIVAENRALVAENLRALDKFTAATGNFWTLQRPKAGTICFPRLRAGLSAEAFCQRVVEDAGIMLLPSTVYDYGDEHVRVGFGRRNFREALAKFRAYLTETNV